MNTTCTACGRGLLTKSNEQRRAFHKTCRIIGKEMGLTPGQVKAWIKQEHFGMDEFKVGDKWVRTVQSSEDADRLEYAELTETAIRCAAEQGIVIQDFEEWKRRHETQN